MLYGKLIKPLLFSLPPEQAHHIVTATLSLLGKVPGGRWLLHKLYATEDPSLEREVFGIRFKNPVGMAAGFDRYGHIYRELSAMGFGFVEVGSITPKRQPGNPKPRIFRLDAARALLNRVGKEIVDNGKKVGGAVTSTATDMIRHELRGGNKKVAASAATEPAEGLAENAATEPAGSEDDDVFTVRDASGLTIPAHEFHHWDATANGDALTAAKANGRQWACGFANAHIYAGFPHLYWAGTPLPQRFVCAAEHYIKERP